MADSCSSGSDSDDCLENAIKKRGDQSPDNNEPEFQLNVGSPSQEPEWIPEQGNSAELSDKTKMIFANVTTDGKDARDFKVEQGVTFDDLKKQIARLFPSLAGYQFDVQCIDADSDIISISTNEEVMTALNKLSDKETWLLLAVPFGEPHDRLHLKKAIQNEVFPCIVSISIQQRFWGTGFFQHVSWLVSNAHMLSSLEDVSGATMSNDQIKSATLFVQNQNAYFRPSEQPKSPDIVVLEITDPRPSASQKSLPTRFPGNEGTIIRVGINFYTYFDPLDNEYKIKYLLPHTTNGLPLLFRCEDNIDPMPGCSGAPIIEAQAVDAGLGEIIWQFKVIGIVYATCTYFLDTKLVCGVPLGPDLKQIRNTVLNSKQSANTIQLFEKAANSLGKKDKEAAYNTQADEAQSMAKDGFKKFEEGKTDLNISVPVGLKKLDGNRIIELKESWLIDVNQKNHPNKTKIKHQVEYEELEKNFKDFITSFEGEESIELKKGDNFLQSKYFRIDVSGGSSADWMLQLQDNTGKEAKVGSKPASSVFAIVKVQFTPRTAKKKAKVNEDRVPDKVSGKDLANAIKDSQREKRPYYIEKQ